MKHAHESTLTASPREPRSRAPYRTPRLEVLGSLRTTTRGTGAMGADIAGAMSKMCDRRVKEAVASIGRHPLGLEVYAYRYRAPFDQRYGTGWQVGFMADEVAAKFPAAVTRGPDGFLRVDYARLPH